MLPNDMQADPQGETGDRPAPRSPSFVQAALPAADEVSPTLRRGLTAPRPTIPARFLYDELGSSLFDAITATPEYYPTRTEAAILEAHLPAMAAARPVEHCTLIDLGAGSCEKAPKLFPFVDPAQYVPVDISVEFLRTAVRRLQLEHPDVDMLGVGTDFSSRLDLPTQVRARRRLFFYPGSSIGNFSRADAVAFLRRVRERMDDEGSLWIGVDLVKDPATLVRAYDDEVGVTAAFNRNTLRNVNRLAGTDFSPKQWRHLAVWNEELSRIEMHLEAREDLVVRWPGGERSFATGDSIHTESSHKYTVDGFRDLLAEANLRTIGTWTDAKNWFGMFAAAPAT